MGKTDKALDLEISNLIKRRNRLQNRINKLNSTIKLRNIKLKLNYINNLIDKKYKQYGK